MSRFSLPHFLAHYFMLEHILYHGWVEKVLVCPQILSYGLNLKMYGPTLAMDQGKLVELFKLWELGVCQR